MKIKMSEPKNTAIKLHNGKLSLIDVPYPKLYNPNKVIIRVTYAGVCGTDLQIIDGNYPAADEVIMGHEIAGVVEEIGDLVTNLKVGNSVCVNPFNFCSACMYCARGSIQFCLYEGMKTALGIGKDGGWQKYVTVSSTLCLVVPDHMDLRDSVFCQPLSNCVRGWDNIRKVDSDARILIAGAGIIGLLWTCLLHFHGYLDVSITEVSEHRKEMASRLDLGFPVLHPDEIENEKKIAEESGNDCWGFDLIIYCTGDKKAIEAQSKWLRKGATFMLFGVLPKGLNLDLEVYQIYRKEITVLSSYLNPFTYAHTLKLVNKMSKRYLDWNKLNVGKFTLAEYETALDKLRRGVLAKVVFEM